MSIPVADALAIINEDIERYDRLEDSNELRTMEDKAMNELNLLCSSLKRSICEDERNKGTKEVSLSVLESNAKAMMIMTGVRVELQDESGMTYIALASRFMQ